MAPHSFRKRLCSVELDISHYTAFVHHMHRGHGHQVFYVFVFPEMTGNAEHLVEWHFDVVVQGLDDGK